jgi:CDP-glycerol glycerophosphotransferase (TagB/SpsB family)
LLEEFKKNNITVFFTLHRYNVDKYSKKYKFIINNNKNIKYVEQNDISNCLTKSSLVISDFSSIIFDFIYRNKPYIIYIPDADDPEIHNIYSNEYSELIESMNNNSFKFENIFFDINQTINKIIFYINNNYTLDYKLNNFYKSFNLKQGNNIEKFIDYLRKLS